MVLKGGDDDVGEAQSAAHSHHRLLPLTSSSSSPPVNVREFCLVIFSHATTLPSYLPTLNEHDEDGEVEGGWWRMRRMRWMRMGMRRRRSEAVVAWERVWPPKGQMRVVSGGARRHLFFPRVTLQSTRVPTLCKPPGQRDTTPTQRACLHSPGGCHHSLEPVNIVATTIRCRLHGKEQQAQSKISVGEPLAFASLLHID